MRRRNVAGAVIAGLAGALLIGCEAGARVEDAHVPPALRGVHRIVCLGDSITEQGGQPGGYVNLLQRYLTALYPSQQITILCTV